MKLKKYNTETIAGILNLEGFHFEPYSVCKVEEDEVACNGGKDEIKLYDIELIRTALQEFKNPVFSGIEGKKIVSKGVYSDGSTKLHYLIESKQWEEALELFNSYSRFESEQVRMCALTCFPTYTIGDNEDLCWDMDDGLTVFEMLRNEKSVANNDHNMLELYNAMEAVMNSDKDDRGSPCYKQEIGDGVDFEHRKSLSVRRRVTWAGEKVDAGYSGGIGL